MSPKVFLKMQGLGPLDIGLLPVVISIPRYLRAALWKRKFIEPMFSEQISELACSG